MKKLLKMRKKEKTMEKKASIRLLLTLDGWQAVSEFFRREELVQCVAFRNFAINAFVGWNKVDWDDINKQCMEDMLCYLREHDFPYYYACVDGDDEDQYKHMDADEHNLLVLYAEANMLRKCDWVCYCVDTLDTELKNFKWDDYLFYQSYRF